MASQARACGVRVGCMRPRSALDSARPLALLVFVAGFVAWGFAASSAPQAAPRAEAVSVTTMHRAAPQGVRRGGMLQMDTRTAPTFDVAPRIEGTGVIATGAVAGLIEPMTLPSTREPAVESEASEAPPAAIQDIRLDAVGPAWAILSWRTSELLFSRVGYGIEIPTLWSPSSLAVEHSARLDGLLPARTYRVWITAQSDDGRTAEAETELTTPARSGAATVTIAGDSLTLDGQPLFPTMVWGQCADGYAQSLAAGINVFMHNPCESLIDQVARLEGSAFVVADAFAGTSAGSNVIGSFLPDEWDTFLPGNLTSEDAADLVPADARAPLFLTLTNHFYSAAAPLPQGRGDYTALADVADVLGFDLYPLQNWCRTDAFGAVFEAQRELVQLAAGKPTFQWIEARVMDCDPSFAVTPQTVRAETWLAIAGGAHGIGYFPHSWAADVGAEITRERQEIDALSPALLAPAIAGTTTSAQVKVGARARNDAVYIIAVNAALTSAVVTLTVPEVEDRSLTTLDGLERFIAGADGSFTDTFDPLAVHIYVAPPLR